MAGTELSRDALSPVQSCLRVVVVFVVSVVAVATYGAVLVDGSWEVGSFHCFSDCSEKEKKNGSRSVVRYNIDHFFKTWQQNKQQ